VTGLEYSNLLLCKFYNCPNFIAVESKTVDCVDQFNYLSYTLLHQKWARDQKKDCHDQNCHASVTSWSGTVIYPPQWSYFSTTHIMRVTCVTHNSHCALCFWVQGFSYQDLTRHAWMLKINGVSATYLGTSWRDNVTNLEVWTRANSRPITETLQKTRLVMLGHVLPSCVSWHSVWLEETTWQIEVYGKRKFHFRLKPKVGQKWRNTFGQNRMCNRK